MLSKKEIDSAFKSMDLHTPKKRECFQKMLEGESETQEKQKTLFIKASNRSDGIDMESQNAELGRNH